MAAKFIAEEGTLKGLELSLNQGNAQEDAWIIGRDPEFCQIVIEDPTVSRKHLLCKKIDEGISIENLSETNKAFINDEEITTPRLLQNSDFLKIGSGAYRFYQEDASSDSESLPSQENVPEDSFQEDSQAKEEVLKTPEFPVSLEAVEKESEDSIFQDDESRDLAEVNFDYTETGRFLLKVISGVNNGAEFPMQTDHTYLIGTDASTCDIIFNDNSVSRQHVRLTVDQENKLIIEDLKSRNGTLVDGEPLLEKKNLDPSALVTIGTTSFIIYDKESAMQTVISPLMPSIVKILQQKEELKRKEEEERERQRIAKEQEEQEKLSQIPNKQEKSNLTAFMLVSIIAGLFILAGIATTTLFKSEPIVSEQTADIDNILSSALSAFPSIKYNFNKSTGQLLLAGHVLTGNDKSQLLYNLQGLKFIKNIDDSGVIIDEFAWREINPTLSKNPAWRSVSIQATSPGKFVLSGYLQTRREAEMLWDYVSNNFAYINLLDKKIVVEEDVVSNVNSLLLHEGLKDVTVQMSEGELTLTGFIPAGKETALATLISDMKTIPGIRDVKNYVAGIAADQSMINLTDKYEITGSSHQGSGNLSVVINGRILIRGDVLDGMLITSIKPNAIFLEKDGVKYRIDYNK